jgi:hypothetical protein
MEPKHAHSQEDQQARDQIKRPGEVVVGGDMDALVTIFTESVRAQVPQIAKPYRSRSRRWRS